MFEYSIMFYMYYLNIRFANSQAPQCVLKLNNCSIYSQQVATSKLHHNQNIVLCLCSRFPQRTVFWKLCIMS